MRNCLCLTAFIATFTVMSLGAAHATLLADRFGVTLLLDTENTYRDSYQRTKSYPTLQSSLEPTRNTETVDYIVDDWWGSWSTTNVTAHVDGPGAGQYPSGGEMYDVEALYFDNDDTNLYIAVVTSFPPSGIYESRADGIFVCPGDLALDLGLNSPYSDGFSYDYGVNISNEIRQTKSNANALPGPVQPVGNQFYRTQNTDWYTGTARNATQAGGELTNFDPNFSPFLGTPIGAVTLDYYEYAFAGGRKETLYPTYIVECTIPISYFPEFVDGQTIGVSWVEGCRNDGNQVDGCIRLRGDHNVPEPGTIALLSMGIAGLVASRRRRKNDSVT